MNDFLGKFSLSLILRQLFCGIVFFVPCIQTCFSGCFTIDKVSEFSTDILLPVAIASLIIGTVIYHVEKNTYSYIVQGLFLSILDIFFFVSDGSFSTKSAENEEKTDLLGQLTAYQQELYYKIINGETERTFAIGAQEFTVREWDKFVERFDESEEYVKESMEEEIAERQEDAKKQNLITEEMIEKLLEDRDVPA